MKLIDFLVQELPKRGGWPEEASSVRQDRDWEVCFNGSTESDFYPELIASDVSEWFDKSEGSTDYPGITREQYEASLAASKQPEWNGEGLPPEGIKCEVKSGKNSWTLCKVVHSSEAGVAFIYLEEPSPESSSGYLGVLDSIPGKRADTYFRSISTEAERKREQAVNAMVDINVNVGESIYSVIYDAIAAGKIPGIKIE